MSREGNPVYFVGTGEPQGIIHARERQEIDTLAFRNVLGSCIFNRSMFSGKQAERLEIIPFPATSELSLLAATAGQLWLLGPEE